MARARVGGLVLGLVLAGCGQGAAATPPPDRAHTVEELATTVGCTPDFQGKGSDFRQAACETGTAKYIFFDFRTDARKRAWLDEALIYGGTYLVGDKWILTTQKDADLERLRGRLGGTIEGDPSIHHG